VVEPGTLLRQRDPVSGDSDSPRDSGRRPVPASALSHRAAPGERAGWHPQEHLADW